MEIELIHEVHITAVTVLYVCVCLFFFQRGHIFDSLERCSSTVRRHSGAITDYGLPSKGTEGVRSYNKTDEENILPHR